MNVGNPGDPGSFHAREQLQHARKTLSLWAYHFQEHSCVLCQAARWAGSFILVRMFMLMSQMPMVHHWGVGRRAERAQWVLQRWTMV